MDLSGLAVFAVAVAVFAGALAQRTSGVGFSLIAAPGLALTMGAFEGILVANVLAAVVSLTLLVASRHDVDWSKVMLLPAGIAGIVPGAVAATTLPPAALSFVVGSLIVLAVAAATLRQGIRVRPSVAVTLCAGTASGFMTATAGVGGPALVVFASMTGWTQRSFAATSQLIFLTQAVVSLAFKGLPTWTMSEAAALVAFALMGLALGHALRDRLPINCARNLALVVACVGGLAAMARGVLS